MAREFSEEQVSTLVKLCQLMDADTGLRFQLLCSMPDREHGTDELCLTMNCAGGRDFLAKLRTLHEYWDEHGDCAAPKTRYGVRLVVGSDKFDKMLAGDEFGDLGITSVGQVLYEEVFTK